MVSAISATYYTCHVQQTIVILAKTGEFLTAQDKYAARMKELAALVAESCKPSPYFKITYRGVVNQGPSSLAMKCLHKDWLWRGEQQRQGRRRARENRQG